MKKILHTFCLLFLPLIAFGQDSATYTFRLDTFGIDSFFLVEVTTIPQSGLPRAIETEYPIYMTDTAQLSAYILSMNAEYDALVSQATDLSNRKGAWAYRYARVQCLRDSVFYGASCSGIGSRMVKAPPPTGDRITQVESPDGFWVQYTGGTVEWVEHIGKVKKNVSFTVLGRDGTKTKFLKPKKSAKKNK